MSHPDKEPLQSGDDSARSSPRVDVPVRVRVRTRAPAPDIQEVASCAAPPKLPQAEYDVGYRKPPRHAQFKPGHSGNPKGRSKNAKGLNTIVRETLGGKVAVRTATGTKQISKIEAVLQKTLEKAMKGDARAQLELMKLWRSAVPDIADADSEPAQGAESMTAADLAILEAYRGSINSEGEGSDPL